MKKTKKPRPRRWPLRLAVGTTMVPYPPPCRGSREVVVLECGHLAVPQTVTTPAGERRCRDCAFAKPADRKLAADAARLAVEVRKVEPWRRKTASGALPDSDPIDRSPEAP